MNNDDIIRELEQINEAIGDDHITPNLKEVVADMKNELEEINSELKELNNTAVDLKSELESLGEKVEYSKTDVNLFWIQLALFLILGVLLAK